MAADAESPAATVKSSGKYDPAARRQAKRSGRERGCWAYIPADELTKAGVDPSGPAPFYRVWGSKSGGVMIRLYREV